MNGYPKELNSVIWDGLCTQAMVSLIGGPFLSAFLLALGANYFWIGLAAAIPPLAQMLQIPSIILIEKYNNRRLICVVTAFVSRFFWIFPVAAVFFLPLHIVLVLTFLAITAQSSIGAIGGTSWNSWMRDIVPESILGSFFSKRMQMATFGSMILLVVTGLFVDKYKYFLPVSEPEAYALIFALGICFGFLGVYFVAKTPNVPMQEVEAESLFRKLLRPFKDKNYRSTIAFLGLWNFAINLAMPFFVVYLIKRLNFEMIYIIGFAVISQIANIIAFPIWGRFADKFSNKTVLAVSGPMFLIVILMWPFTTLPSRYLFTVPLLIIIHILGGFSTAGTMLASGNIALKKAPMGQATSYLAVNSVISSLTMFVAPIIGGYLAYYFSVRELSVTVEWTSPGTLIAFQTLNFRELDFLFFIAAILGFIVIQVLNLVKEDGEIEERILIRELLGQMQRNILNISTVTGFRYLVSFPYYMLMLPVNTFKKVKDIISKNTYEKF